MRYMLLIYSDEKLDTQMTPEQGQQIMVEYNAYTEAVTKSGAYLSGDALQPTSTATTVRLRDGKVLTTDGPFAETKEQLGGFYMVNGKDLDEAISWASKIPGAKYGSIEVRPIMEFS